MENKTIKGDYTYIKIDGIYRRVYDDDACITEQILTKIKCIDYDNENIRIKPLFTCTIEMCKTCKHKHCLEF